MLGVVIGFGIVALVVAVGFGVGRLNILGPHAVDVLSKAAFFVFSPALLFIVLGRADIGQLFSNLLPVSAVAAGLTALISVLVGWFVRKRRVGALTVGALAGAYVNANNIGLPLAAYVLGDPALVAPILLLQLMVMTPVALTILDITSRGSFSLVGVLMQPLRNPLIIGSFLGVIVSAFDVSLPVIVLEPLELLGQAAVPTLLFVLGLSLASQKMWDAVDQRPDIVLASVLKLLVMPLIAWVAGRFLFELDAQALYTVVLLAALPSAQNVFNYAKRYEVATALARDAVVITTVLSLPLMMLVAYLLAPS